MNQGKYSVPVDSYFIHFLRDNKIENNRNNNQWDVRYIPPAIEKQTCTQEPPSRKCSVLTFIKEKVTTKNNRYKNKYILNTIE